MKVLVQLVTWQNFGVMIHVQICGLTLLKLMMIRILLVVLALLWLTVVMVKFIYSGEPVRIHQSLIPVSAVTRGNMSHLQINGLVSIQLVIFLILVVLLMVILLFMAYFFNMVASIFKLLILHRRLPCLMIFMSMILLRICGCNYILIIIVIQNHQPFLDIAFRVLVHASLSLVVALVHQLVQAPTCFGSMKFLRHHHISIFSLLNFKFKL
mmetsp:Transcript_23496/g.30542  ORF Transcript_23496/g.30542 Transcript_23496/m.30542 type:complete len:211 (-) Transcript_23496:66-698(-)